MTLSEIVAEMARKPDPQVLLEWIDGWSDSSAIHEAIYAYFASLEDES